ncbi:nitroreductase/quinone reductase family protein [Amycolatopsis sp. NPDC051716]|uniref:nitroreductase/quinone reductase family protein n=1 Tax=Amycolatopsis sp. NPDC051716 TaxID=3155804 RepID=UPI00342CF0E6
MKPPPPTSRYWKLQRRLARLNTFLFRTTGGKVGGSFFGGAPVLLLHHVGRKSGEARISPLIYVDDSPRLVVVASKGGVDAHPAWFHNLTAMAATEVELPGGERRRVRPRVAEGAERARLWERAVAVYKPYATYATYTERKIPVVVLEPADA